MAVLVLYRRRLEDVACWPVLSTWLQRQAGGLRQCVIYDNSPVTPIDAATLPPGAVLIHDPDNGGTAPAYVAAVAIARRTNCRWLLLLDQDTSLPDDYLSRATAALLAMPSAAALVPRVRHGEQLVSPAVITRLGSVRPCEHPDVRDGLPTAISSGTLIRHQTISTAAFPPEIWLDYVDHWMFLNLSSRGETIGLIDTTLSHDLSVRRPATLSVDRIRSILAAERAFFARVGGPAASLLPLRRLLRALRYTLIGRPSLAAVVLRGGRGANGTSPHD